MLGSDAREPGKAEPGATIGGPSRADSILLIRAGGGKSAKLSIPRDTVVDIPGHGPDKINAAYAIGGPSLMINTVEEYLGIEVNHVIEVNFGNFPEFIDALGGINVKTSCVCSDINGGKKNGGTTLKLKRGDNHLSGEQALALARTRKNACNPAENDLARAKAPAGRSGGDQVAAWSPPRRSSGCRGWPGRRRRRCGPTWAARRCWASPAPSRSAATPSPSCSAASTRPAASRSARPRRPLPYRSSSTADDAVLDEVRGAAVVVGVLRGRRSPDRRHQLTGV